MIDFPNITVAFSVLDNEGEVVHTGKYRLRDDVERRAFGQRCHEAIADGYEVRTWRHDTPPKNFGDK